MGGGAVVAVMAAARQKRILAIVDAFRAAGATEADRATTFDALEIDPDWRETRELVDDTVLLRGGAPNRWYLSEINYVDYSETRERRTQMALMIVMLLALAAAVLAITIGRG